MRATPVIAVLLAVVAPAVGRGDAPDTKPPDMVRAYPEKAARLGTAGLVKLKCKVMKTGLVEDCIVLSEDPAGQGFGKAALRLSHLFKMKPTSKDGTPTAGAFVVIPIRFKLPDAEPPPSPTPPPPATNSPAG